MADDNIEKLAGSLKDLNSTLSLTDTKTLGFYYEKSENKPLLHLNLERHGLHSVV